MNPAAPFGSILFDRPPDRGERDDPSMFGDLNLDQVFGAVVAGRDEFELMPFFRVPLRDVRTVEYRHEVQRDLDNKAVAETVAAFAARMRDMRKHLAQADKLRKQIPERTLVPGCGQHLAAGRRRPGGRARRGRARLARLYHIPAAPRGLHARQPEQSWRDRIPGMNRNGYTFYIAERDDAGMRTLSDLTTRGLNGTANAPAQSADHIRSFFQMLRAELAFYLGCLNLRDQLTARGQPVCFPDPIDLPPTSAGHVRLSARGLYDASLALSLHDAGAVGNAVNADGTQLIMITGANQGGKSTFLRSVGLAQLMMQASWPRSRSPPASAPGSSRTSSARKTPRSRRGNWTRN